MNREGDAPAEGCVPTVNTSIVRRRDEEDVSRKLTGRSFVSLTDFRCVARTGIVWITEHYDIGLRKDGILLQTKMSSSVPEP